MYGFDYGYEPATEGVASFFSAVMDKIREAGEKIKDWIDKVALKIKRFTNMVDSDQVKSDSADALKDIDEIGKNIVQILDGCEKEIDILVAAYSVVGKYDKTYDGTSQSDEQRGSSFKKSLSTPGGMDKIDDSIKKDSATMKEWANVKEKVAIELSKQKGLAEKTSAKLKGLAKYGPLTLKATKNGYDDLRAIFNANGQFGNQWKRVKVAAEWATGDIKNALNKVVAMYDVGIRATESFGARLASGFVRDDNGEKMKKEELKGVKGEYKNINKIYKSNKSRSDISSKKDERGNVLANVNNANDVVRYVKNATNLDEYSKGTDAESRFGKSGNGVNKVKTDSSNSSAPTPKTNLPQTSTGKHYTGRKPNNKDTALQYNPRQMPELYDDNLRSSTGRPNTVKFNNNAEDYVIYDKSSTSSSKRAERAEKIYNKATGAPAPRSVRNRGKTKAFSSVGAMFDGIQSAYVDAMEDYYGADEYGDESYDDYDYVDESYDHDAEMDYDYDPLFDMV